MIYIASVNDLEKTCVHIRTGKEKIQAIKELRAVANLGLKDAKDIIDNCDPHLTYSTSELLATLRRMDDVTATVTGATFTQEGFPLPLRNTGYSASPPAPGDFGDMSEVVEQLKLLTKATEMMFQMQHETNQLLKDLLDVMSE